MALEKFIHGKRDEAHHDGLYSNRKRLDEALSQLEEGEQIMASMMVWRQRESLPFLDPQVLEFHRSVLDCYCLLDGDELVV